MSDTRPAHTACTALVAARRAQDAWEALCAIPVALDSPEALAVKKAAFLDVASAAGSAARAFGARRRALVGCRACIGTGLWSQGVCPHCMGTGDRPGSGHLDVCRPCRLAMEGQP